MTGASTGSGSSSGQSEPDPDEGSGEGSGRTSKAVRIAIIGAAGAILAGAIPVLLTLDNDDPSSSSSPSSSSVSASASVSATSGDPCDLDRLIAGEESWVRPPAQRFNSKLFADRKPRVLTKVSSDQNPRISVRGQVSLTVPAGQVLYLVSQPDRNTKDEFGNPGSNQYYPVTSVTPDSDGCWEDGDRPLGYDGARGITDIYRLFLVGQSQVAKFTRDREAKEWDGYSYAQWRDVGAISVLEFRVPTVT